MHRLEWYEKAQERGYTVTQYNDSKSISHVVVGDPTKTNATISPDKDIFIVFFKKGMDGPAFVLPIDGDEDLVSTASPCFYR